MSKQNISLIRTDSLSAVRLTVDQAHNSSKKIENNKYLKKMIYLLYRCPDMFLNIYYC